MNAPFRSSLSHALRIEVKKSVSSSTFLFLCTLLLSKKELNELPDDSINIFKKSNIDQYIIRRNALFGESKYSALDHFCYTEFSAYYTINKKPDHSSEYQPDEFQDKLIEENHEECDYHQKNQFDEISYKNEML